MAGARDGGPAIGRRERKRRETRHRLVRAALDLFAEEGFDEVTVSAIAERADVDPSTFFRHFGSKEAVLFADDEVVVSRAQAAIIGRPVGEPTLVGLREAMRDLTVDLESEGLRLRLAESSATVRSELVLRNVRLADDLCAAIATHLGVDAAVDPVPFLVARLWVDAATWLRADVVASGRRVTSTAEGLDRLDELVRSILPVLMDER